MKKNKNRTTYCFRITSLLLFLLLILVSSKCVSLHLENKTLKQELLAEKEKNAISTPSETPFPSEPTNTVTPTAIPTEVLLSSIEKFSAGEIIDRTKLDNNNLTMYFTANEISEEIKERITGKSYKENPDISLEELRYLKLLHYNFDHQIQVGELIVNESIAEDCIEIFTELFQAEYEIQSMYLIDDYWTGDGTTTDTASMNANNSSAFCYRVIAGSSKLSNHALGCALDINPYQNPYITYKNDVPVFYHDNAEEYADRTTEKDHMITHNDLCYKLFTSHGFTWGGDWKNSKDYQHFEKAD